MHSRLACSSPTNVARYLFFQSDRLHFSIRAHTRCDCRDRMCSTTCGHFLHAIQFFYEHIFGSPEEDPAVWDGRDGVVHAIMRAIEAPSGSRDCVRKVR